MVITPLPRSSGQATVRSSSDGDEAGLAEADRRVRTSLGVDARDDHLGLLGQELDHLRGQHVEHLVAVEPFRALA